MQNGSGTPKRRSKFLAPEVGFAALWIAALFGSAGTFAWTRGWIYFGISVFQLTLIGVTVHRYNPGLLQARRKMRRSDTKRFDRFILALYVPLTYLQPAIGGLDFRFGWSSMPFATVYVGAALFTAATALIDWAMLVNRFAETTVRIQTERGHAVVSSGPYRYVRHPMYVGASLLHVGTGLILGSTWALALGGLEILLLLVRTALEDATLRQELPGYAKFAEQTRYRLLPGIW
jgi:protein-S-isoprenylcysteine O-methyltransferase Ste14